MTSTLPPLILNSLPKSGTHLLTRLFELLPNYSHSGIVLTNETVIGAEDNASKINLGVNSPKGMRKSAFSELISGLKNNQFHFGHLPYSTETAEILQQHQTKLIALVRDPRAVVCSNVHFILKHQHHQLFEIFTSLPDLESQIKLAIKGFESSAATNNQALLPIGACFDSIADWGTNANAHLILFEDLIGAKGGGSNERQQRLIHKVLDYVGCKMNDQEVKHICEQLFLKTSPTFFRGRVDGWREDFSGNLEEYFDKHAKQSLLRFKELQNNMVD